MANLSVGFPYERGVDGDLRCPAGSLPGALLARARLFALDYRLTFPATRSR
jgi:hypothetical protein